MSDLNVTRFLQNFQVRLPCGKIAQLDGRITQLEKNVDAKIEQLEKNVSAKLQQLEDKTDAKHARLGARMYRALWMQAGAIVAAIVALMKLLP